MPTAAARAVNDDGRAVAKFMLNVNNDTCNNASQRKKTII